jgi:hypothetical protein
VASCHLVELSAQSCAGREQAAAPHDHDFFCRDIP